MGVFFLFFASCVMPWHNLGCELVLCLNHWCLNFLQRGLELIRWKCIFWTNIITLHTNELFKGPIPCKISFFELFRVYNINSSQKKPQNTPNAIFYSICAFLCISLHSCSLSISSSQSTKKRLSRKGLRYTLPPLSPLSCTCT